MWIGKHCTASDFATPGSSSPAEARFIGSHLAETLWRLGAQVVVIDDLSGGSEDNLKSFGPVEFHKGSILDRDLLAACSRGCKYVFHQAALGSVPRTVEQPRLYNDVNTTGTLNVLEAALAAKVSRVMFAASSSADGTNRFPGSRRCRRCPKALMLPTSWPARGRRDLKPVYEPPRAGDILHSYADMVRSEELLKFQPIVGFRPGLEQTLG